jgi:hypothetical protein
MSQQHQTARNNIYPSRPKGSPGLYNRTKSRKDFHRKYYSAIIKKPLPYNITKPLYEDLCNKMGDLLLRDKYIYIPWLGFFGLVAVPRASQNLNKRTNWADTYKLWAELYPQKTVEELKEIKGKPFVNFRNKMGNVSFQVSWIKINQLCKTYEHVPITKVHKSLGRLANEPGDTVLMSYTDLKELINKLRS